MEFQKYSSNEVEQSSFLRMQIFSHCIYSPFALIKTHNEIKTSRPKYTEWK